MLKKYKRIFVKIRRSGNEIYKKALDNTIDRFILVNDREEEKIILRTIHFERSILLKPIKELSCAYKRWCWKWKTFTSSVVPTTYPEVASHLCKNRVISWSFKRTIFRCFSFILNNSLNWLNNLTIEMIFEMILSLINKL